MARIELAVARALNRTAQTLRTQATRTIAADVGLAQKDVRPAIRVDLATQARLLAALEISGRRIPLIAFHARGPEPSRGRGHGVTYRLPGGRGRHPHAFIVTIPGSGHRGVFARSATKRMRRDPRRQAIVELFGPSLPQVFRRKAIPELQKLVGPLVKKNLAHELRFLFGGRAGARTAAPAA